MSSPQDFPSATRQLRPELVNLLRVLKPGSRIKVTQTVRVGSTAKWTATVEGVFRNALVRNGRNRDTAWYAIIDRDWPAIKAAIKAWLEPRNFDAQGRQISPLSALKR